jgi:hypothetical protein
MPTNRQLPEPNNVLFRMKRGFSGYVSYLAACEMNTSFSEYVLYEPILRILTARTYEARCEVPCPGIRELNKGDFRRIDFVAEGHGLRLAIEVKWAKRRNLNVEKDLQKLAAFRAAVPGGRSFLCVFGPESQIRNMTLVPDSWKEVGKPVFADFGITRYGCRIFETQPNQHLQPTAAVTTQPHVRRG